MRRTPPWRPSRSSSPDVTLLGWHRLGDLGPAEHVWQLRHPDLPAGFPPPRSLDAHPHNLPVQLTSFVGRDAELAELAALIDNARLAAAARPGWRCTPRVLRRPDAERRERCPTLPVPPAGGGDPAPGAGS